MLNKFSVSYFICCPVARQGFGWGNSSVTPTVKESYVLIREYVILTFVEFTVNQKRIVHIQNSVLYSIVIFVKNISYRFFSFFICRNIRSSGIMIIFYNVVYACISVKAHCIFYRLCNKCRSYKSA